MKKSLSVVVLLAYTIIGPVVWLAVFIVTLPFVWKSVLSGKRLSTRRVPFCVPPKPQPKPVINTTMATSATMSGNPTTSAAPKSGPVDIQAKMESGTMTPEDWRHVAVFHNREHKC